MNRAESVRGVPLAGVGRIDAGIVRQAATFQMRLWSGMATEDDIEACRQWRQADPVHEQAWQRIGAIGQRLHAVPQELVRRTLHDAPADPGRRKAVRTLGVALAGGLVAGYSVQHLPAWQRMVGDHATAVGQWGHIMLPDGTRVDLNTASAIDLHYTDTERGIQLRTGEILVTSAADAAVPPRPLQLRTEHGLVTATDARCALRHDAGQTQLAVFGGAVELTPRHGVQTHRVAAGQRVVFDAQGIVEQGLASDNDIAWVRGLIIAERKPLGSFLQDIQRYRHGLVQCDPVIAAHPLTGVFSLRDTDAILDALQHGLPVRQRRITRYWVRFRAA